LRAYRKVSRLALTEGGFWSNDPDVFHSLGRHLFAQRKGVLRCSGLIDLRSGPNNVSTVGHWRRRFREGHKGYLEQSSVCAALILSKLEGEQ